MLSKCVRQILSKRQICGVSKNLLPGSSVTGKNVIVSNASNQGHLAGVLPARNFSVSKIFLDQVNVKEDEDYMYGNNNDQWTKVDDNSDEVTGAFSNFRITPKTIQKLNDQGINHLFSVQSSTFNVIYDEFDVIVQARTGSGKTMSFALPIVEKILSRGSGNKLPKLLVLTPTRELANQISGVFKSLSDELKIVPVYGGSSITSQEMQLMRGADIVVGTPGRVLDLTSRGKMNLSMLDHVVLDEVDRMLDMGFSDDVEKILNNRYKKDKRDSNPQTLLFSATVPSWVRDTSKKYLSRDLKMIDLIGKDANRTSVNVKHIAISCNSGDRTTVILDALKRHGDTARVIVFCQTKREVDQLANNRALRGKVGALHGDVSQIARESTLRNFKEGRLSCLVATDVAARGLDVPDVDVVIQCSPPNDVESYIHRSGRTGRAGKSGESILLYTAQELQDVRKIEGIAKIQFQKTMFKKTMDEIKSDFVDTLKNVTERDRLKFSKIASELLEKEEPLKILAAAVAIVSGHEQKSLISSQVGLVTFKLTSGKRFSQKFEAETYLSRVIPDIMAQNLTICANNNSVVFDIPVRFEDNLVKSAQRGDFTVEAIETLPELLDTSYDKKSFSGFDRSTSSLGSYGGYSGKKQPSTGGFRRESYGGFRKESYGDRQSYGGDRQSYGGDRQSYGGDRQSYGGDRQGSRQRSGSSFSQRRMPSLEDYE